MSENSSIGRQQSITDLEPASSDIYRGAQAKTEPPTTSSEKLEMALAAAAEAARWMFPPLTWIRETPPISMLKDFVNGAILFMVYLPSAIAVAGFITAPLQSTILGAAVSSLVYAIIGEHAPVSLGTTNEIGLLLNAVSGTPSSAAARGSYFQTVSLFAGLMGVLAAVLQGGVIIRNSFARAVGDAFSVSSCILIGISQIRVMFNLKTPTGNFLHEIIGNIIEGFKTVDINSLYSFLCFLAIFIVLFWFRFYRPKWIPEWIPVAGIMLVISIIVTWSADLNTRIKLRVLGKVPTTLYQVQAPPITATILGEIAFTSFICMLIGFLQTYTVALRLSKRDIDPNKELLSVALAQTACGIFGGMPPSAAFSRASVMQSLGVMTPITGLISAGCLLITVGWLLDAGVFTYLPSVATGAILVMAAIPSINFTFAIYLFKNFKLDFFVWLVTTVLILFQGVVVGMLSGIGVSICLVLFRVARPPTRQLAFDPLRGRFVDSALDPELLVYPGVLVWQFEAPLYFINVAHFCEALTDAVAKETRKVLVVIVDCSRIPALDSTSTQVLGWSLTALETKVGIKILFAQVSKDVEESLLSLSDSPFTPETFHATIPLALLAASEAVNKMQDAKASEAAAGLDSTTPNEPIAPVAAVSSPQSPSATAVCVHAEPERLDVTKPVQLGVICCLETRDDRRPSSVVLVACHADRTPKQKLILRVNNEALIRYVFPSPEVLPQGEFAEVRIPRSGALWLAVFKYCTDLALGDGASQDDAVVMSASTPASPALLSVSDETRSASSSDLRQLMSGQFANSPDAAPEELLRTRSRKSLVRRTVPEAASADESSSARAIARVMAASSGRCKVVLRASFSRASASSAPTVSKAVLVCKWGGTLTSLGKHQAVAFADSIRRRLALHTTAAFAYRIHACEEDRVQETAKITLKSLQRRIADHSQQFVSTEDVALEPTCDDTHEQRERTRRFSPFVNAVAHCSVPALATQLLHIIGVRGVLNLPDVKAPFDALVRVYHLLTHIVQAASKVQADVLLGDAEPIELFVRRYQALLTEFTRVEGVHDHGSADNNWYDALQSSAAPLSERLALHQHHARLRAMAAPHSTAASTQLFVPAEGGDATDADPTLFDADKVRMIFDYSAFDYAVNYQRLVAVGVTGLDELFHWSRRLVVMVRGCSMGGNPSERFSTAAAVIAPLMSKLHRHIDESLGLAAAPSFGNAAAAGSSAAAVAAAPTNIAPVDMYFTASVVTDALRVCITNSRVLGGEISEAATEYAESVELSGWHYLSHIMIKVFPTSTRGGGGAASDGGGGNNLVHRALDRRARVPFAHHAQYDDGGAEIELFLASGAALLKEEQDHADIADMDEFAAEDDLADAENAGGAEGSAGSGSREGGRHSNSEMKSVRSYNDVHDALMASGPSSPGGAPAGDRHHLQHPQSTAAASRPGAAESLPSMMRILSVDRTTFNRFYGEVLGGASASQQLHNLLDELDGKPVIRVSPTRVLSPGTSFRAGR